MLKEIHLKKDLNLVLTSRPFPGTLRWRLVDVAGKVVRHGRQLILKLAVPLEKLVVYLRIRQACLEFG